MRFSSMVVAPCVVAPCAVMTASDLAPGIEQVKSVIDHRLDKELQTTFVWNFFNSNFASQVAPIPTEYNKTKSGAQKLSERYVDRHELQSA